LVQFLFSAFQISVLFFDVFVRLSQRNAEQLLAAFKDFGFDIPELTVSVFMEPGKIVRIGVPPLRLEVMNDISGVVFEQCYSCRVEATIAGVRISFIDRENLLLNKQAAGRPKDMADVVALIRIRGEGKS